jgi:UDP-GlcNAc3NAcA epimerase
MKKIVTVLGARPQFIKASVVSKAIEQAGKLQEIVVHTGQHFDSNMSEVFFKELGINTPQHHLQISGGRHGEMTGRMLVAIEKVLMEEKPDVVMVYGDTNSTLAGALAAVKLGIPVAHVEAGLRSFNLAMPEEVNRILTDRISRWLFTPTETASCHLRREGVEDERIISVGDVMYDVALYHGAQSDAASEILLKLRLTKGSYALATIHRAENTDRPERLAEVVGGLVLLAETIPVVWPLHPRTRGVLARYPVLQSQAKRLCLVDPVGYLDMVQLERNAGLIVTDSGGVQKEAFFHQVPCVTLRAETEWIETVELGWNRLCPTHEPRQLAQTCLEALHTRGRNDQPYGAGDAAQKIAASLATRISFTP